MNQNGHTHIDAVIFDIGRVLIGFDFNRAFKAAEAFVGIPALEIRAKIFGASDFAGYDRERDIVEFECGRISEREFHSRVERTLQCRIPYELFCHAWNGIFDDEISGTVESLRQLHRRGLKVGILSNTNRLHFEHLRVRMPVLSEIQHVYASHEIGCRKPDAESYHHALKKMDVAAQRTVFVDDLPDNVAAAQKIGMKTIHAVSSEAVRTGLSELGIL